MADRKCKECSGDFAPKHPKQLYCKKCRPVQRERATVADSTKRAMPVKAHFCYNCGMPQPKEVIVG